MASINDVFNAINKVNTTLWNEIAATNNVNTSVNTLDGDVKSGFTATVNGLTTIAQIDTAIADLLFHLTQQADTIICNLQQISQNTCGILTQVAFQTQLQERLAKDADSIRNIEASAHPEAALELHRLAELKEQIEKCCPPPQPKPACTYSPCPTPKQMPMPQIPRVNPSTGNQPK